ncbi:MAG: hypothetical protein CL793_07465 [Chloroflexi bacterium]|nr:hypothetical protein [Chloroflexota bacterium]|tara:strand:- start:5261 stop:6067 length:807 start_codon:yes stop_codon:yes gene_type:complete
MGKIEMLRAKGSSDPSSRGQEASRKKTVEDLANQYARNVADNRDRSLIEQLSVGGEDFPDLEIAGGAAFKDEVSRSLRNMTRDVGKLFFETATRNALRAGDALKVRFQEFQKRSLDGLVSMNKDELYSHIQGFGKVQQHTLDEQAGFTESVNAEVSNFVVAMTDDIDRSILDDHYRTLVNEIIASVSELGSDVESKEASKRFRNVVNALISIPELAPVGETALELLADRLSGEGRVSAFGDSEEAVRAALIVLLPELKKTLASHGEQK